MTLEARVLLTGEAAAVLEGIYGLGEDGRFEPVENLPALRELDEAAQTREQLETFFREEADAGIAGSEAVEKLKKEVAFTWLNRLVAFKMLEDRKLVRGTVDKGHNSNAFLFYLNGHPDDYERYQAGSRPQNALGERPRDIAYRHFLLDQCAKLAEEVNVLFDPNTLPSRLCPRPRALHELLGLLNDSDLDEAWRQGNEETIGWVYQFFVQDEKKAVFDRLYRQKKKVRRQDVAPATELFTPRWYVRFLVQNSLGSQWVQMHPESALAGSLEYLVPLDEDVPAVPLKPVAELTMLDPACGTMHFGLVAFDLFAEMYREELANAGNLGWPETPSVRNVKEIPAAIIANNLFGIDIDLRAVQLSALTLFLKAKTANPEARITESHLACADIDLPSEEELEEFLSEMAFQRPVYERAIRAMWHGLADVGQLGSLIRIEDQLRDIVQRERSTFADQLSLFTSDDLFRDAYRSDASFWEVLDAQIVQAFDEFARRRARSGEDRGFFRDVAVRGCDFLNVLTRRYDVITTNPPYMTRRNMNKTMADFLSGAYPKTKGDLYAAFIERCCELLEEHGRVGMITQQSFMFISSYEKMRRDLRAKFAIETLPHLGSRGFDEITGEKVNATLFTLRAESDQESRENAMGTYFRLVREPDCEAKRQAFEDALAKLRTSQLDSRVYHYRQSDFDAIQGSPWVYWVSHTIRHIFRERNDLGHLSPARQGLATADNFRFLRFWWEAGGNRVHRNCNTIAGSVESNGRWFPYMKGGGFRRWYGNQKHVVNWDNNGKDIRNLGIETGRVASRPQNTDYYFRRGVTWSDLTSGRFAARLSPGGFIFDVKGSSAFPEDVELVLGLLNSSFAHYALSLLNPTVSFQVGDLARLPIPSETSETLRDLGAQAVDLAKSDSRQSETTYDFVAPPAWATGTQDIADRHAELARVEAAIDDEVYRLYGLSDEDRAAIEAELSSGTDEDDHDVDGDDDDEAPSLERADLARQWISYAVGIVLGRFQPGIEDALGRGEFDAGTAEALRGLADADGVACLDEGHEDDLVAKVWRALELMAGEGEVEPVIEAACAGRGTPADRLRNHFQKQFFKEHVRQYRKRPVYWFLQSPGKKYGLYVFHERLTRDTLPLVRGRRYLGAKLNGTRQRINSVQTQLRAAEGSARRQLERDLDYMQSLLTDLEAFDAAIQRVLEMQNERGETVGWEPAIDDGVILNMAPLYELVPSWRAEPKKHWQRLAGGDFDWAFTAKRYWPDRVLDACKYNKSFAIAHGVEELYEQG